MTQKTQQVADNRRRAQLSLSVDMMAAVLNFLKTFWYWIPTQRGESDEVEGPELGKSDFCGKMKRTITYRTRKKKPKNNQFALFFKYVWSVWWHKTKWWHSSINPLHCFMVVLSSCHQTITNKVAVAAAAACVISVFAELTWDQLSGFPQNHFTVRRRSECCMCWLKPQSDSSSSAFGAGKKTLSHRNHIKQADSRRVTWLSSFTMHWFIYLFVQRCWCHQPLPACLWEPKRMNEGKKHVTSQNDESASWWRCR